jgi:hypothetical protein
MAMAQCLLGTFGCMTALFCNRCAALDMTGDAVTRHWDSAASRAGAARFRRQISSGLSDLMRGLAGIKTSSYCVNSDGPRQPRSVDSNTTSEAPSQPGGQKEAELTKPLARLAEAWSVHNSQSSIASICRQESTKKGPRADTLYFGPGRKRRERNPEM